jgi:putative sterol carrier protein
VAVQFLSQEWIDALTSALNEDAAFREAAAGTTVSLQQVIARPDGDVHYWTTLTDGVIAFGIGDLDAPDATIRQSYDTAVGLARRETNAVMAFMTGKIKIEGDMGRLMAMQGILSKLADVMGTLDVDY